MILATCLFEEWTYGTPIGLLALAEMKELNPSNARARLSPLTVGSGLLSGGMIAAVATDSTNRKILPGGYRFEP
jgi:hypothetical protein